MKRQTLVSVLNTNGQVEPFERVPVHAEREGRLVKLMAAQGDRVAAGALLAQIEPGGARAELEAAEARLAQADADQAVQSAGGPATELASLENALKRAQLERAAAQREVASLERLVERQAATRTEVDAARDRLRAAEAEIAGVENQRSALASPQAQAAIAARVREARAAVDAARKRLELTSVRAPLSGVIYNLAARRGDYLRPGELLAEIGALERLRVIIYVDEPELSRVSPGMEAVISWDARPGKEWVGRVEKMPDQIVSLGTRQVGEVAALIDNPGGELPAGANINAAVRSGVAEDALTVPKAAVLTRAGEVGVHVLEDEQLRWRRVKLGLTNVVDAQVLEGLREGEAVALPSGIDLRDGLRVKPILE